MGLYVIINKIYEDNEKVIYTFGPCEEELEELEVIKKTGEITKIKQNINSSNIYYLKVVIKLTKYIKNNVNLKEFPDTLYWTS